MTNPAATNANCRRIALIAHDNKKRDMREWARYNHRLVVHELFANATTGRMLQDELDLDITCFRSGPYGGDQQIGARIAEGEIDLLVFLWDPLEPHPHDPDVKALLRVAVVCNTTVDLGGTELLTAGRSARRSRVAGGRPRRRPPAGLGR